MLSLIIPFISFGQNTTNFEKLPYDSETKSIHFYRIVSLPSVSKEELNIQVNQSITHINSNGELKRYSKRYNGFTPMVFRPNAIDAITDSVVTKSNEFWIHNAATFGKGTVAKCVVKLFIKNGRIKMDFDDFNLVKSADVSRGGISRDKLKDNSKSLDIVNAFNQFAIYIEEYLKVHKTQNSNF